MRTRARLTFFLLITIWTVTGCASLDSYLETSISTGPTVVYDFSINRSESDTLVLLGVDDPTVISKLQYVSLDFVMKNTNTDLGIIDVSTQKISDLLQFSEMTGLDLARFRLLFPDLKNMAVFAVRLQDLTVSQEQLDKYQSLKEGEWQNIQHRNGELIKDRQTRFIAVSMTNDQSDLFGKIMINTFQAK